MKPPLESRITKKILERLRSRGGFWFKLHVSEFQEAGIPDIIGCYRGRFVSFEVKRPGNHPTKLQEYKMKQITQAGGIARVIHSAEEAEAVIDELE